MRTARRSEPVQEPFSDALRAFLGRRAAELSGLSLIALTALVALALATWSVGDPSFNHATTASIQNWVGRPGAFVADLLMQLMGLGSLALLLPVLAWGWRLMRKRDLPHIAWRLGLWILGAGTAAAMASALPVTTSWPLPTGLGGVIGDALLNLAKTLTGTTQGPGAAIIAFIFAGMAILSLTAACGFGFAEPQSVPSGAKRREPRFDDRDDYQERPTDDEPGWAIISLGAVVHGLMSLRANLGRKLSLRRERLAFAGAGYEPMAPARPKREPVFKGHLDDEDDIEDERPALRAKPRVAPPPIEEDEDEEPVAPARSNARVIPRADLKSGKAPARAAKPVAPAPIDYEFPELTLLTEPKKQQGLTVSSDILEQNAATLESVLEDFGVRGEIINVRPGPVVTLYELEPAPGTKSSRVISLADDIARSMSAVSARVAVVQGRNAIGIELPNQKRETVFLRELLASQDFDVSKQKLALCLGKTIGGEPVVADLAKMPHLLVAGTTGSGKSVAINTMILSLLYRMTPEQCRLIMVDPKMLELSVYDGIPHLLSPVVTDPKKAVIALKWAVREMEERYKKMSKLGVRNIDGFNARVAEASAKGQSISRTIQTGFDRETGEALYEERDMDLQPLPYIVVIVDEMADLMMVAGKEIEGAIQRLAQMARAAGIHLIMATQRPSVDVITGTIKANFPTRISFQVTSKIDSRTILGEMGAEQLLGQGDMLYMAGGGRITRVHGPFVSDSEVEKVVAHLKAQGRPDYLDAVTSEENEGEGEGDDSAPFDKGSFGEPSGDLYDQAIAIILRDKKASTSYIQRRLQIGYNRAASLMERMEREGIVGPANHAGKREILIEAGYEREEDDE